MIQEEQQKPKKMAIHIPQKKRPSIIAQEMVKDLRERQKQYEMINKPYHTNISQQSSENRNNKYRDLVQAVKQKYFQDQVAQKKAMKTSQLNELAEHARREKEIQKKIKAEYSKTKVEKEEDFNCLPVFALIIVLLIITVASLLIYG